MLLMLRLGKKNQEIASELGISENTVKTHLSSLFKKIGAGNRTQASHWEG
jgi:DNA-binding NarL/FixJ family response regulator